MEKAFDTSSFSLIGPSNWMAYRMSERNRGVVLSASLSCEMISVCSDISYGHGLFLLCDRLKLILELEFSG